MMKDRFSAQSGNYSKFRPTYPMELFIFLKEILNGTENAWDCGTGNGQVAFELSAFFTTVFATDISQQQLNHAKTAENIIYSNQSAEKTDFPNHFFDLITVAQAIHWFNFDEFYQEVKRTAKNGALMVVIGYGRLQISPEIDRLITNFYINIIGKYWDPERHYIDENYETIPFPFTEIDTPRFKNEFLWTLPKLVGYLNTWSAVKNFINEKSYNAVDALEKELLEIWKPDEAKPVTFPILLRVGKINF